MSATWWVVGNAVRYVERNAGMAPRMVLQQMWVRMAQPYSDMPAKPTGEHEWRDVPMQPEMQPIRSSDWLQPADS